MPGSGIIALNSIVMRKGIITLLVSLTHFFSAVAQNRPVIQDRLKVFIDCQSGCDMTFIRSEINIVDFLLDRQAADVHVLITDQNTGGGGDEYQLIFFGQNQFRLLKDTLRFINDPNATDFEERDLLIKYLKLGLAPYIARTKMAGDIQIQMKTEKKDDDSAKSSSGITKDPWNYWVFRAGANGNINADAVYKDQRWGGNFSANRTTEDLKVNFSLYGSKNKSVFEYEENGVTQKIVVNNHNYQLSHYLVKSINSHWSYGYEANYYQNSFANMKGQIFVRAAVEYDIFPYKEVNNRFFTISYGFTGYNNHYYDTTIYNKTKETLFGQRADANISFNQKWGSSSIGINYRNYFHDWKLFNLGINASTNIRITGGLSFEIYLYGALTRDQINLPKGGATEQEILTRRRQIASGYSYYTSFGLSYRFGSKLNNFVNPRFEGGNN